MTPDLFPEFPSSLTFKEQKLDSFIKENPLVKSIFFIKPSDSLRINHPSLIYFPEIVTQTGKINSPYDYINLFLQGWNYEYQEKDLQKTLLYYKERLNEFEQKEIKGYSPLILLLMVL